MSILLLTIDNLGLVDRLLEFINSCLLSLNLFLQLGKQRVLLCDNCCVIFELFIFPPELLFKCYFVGQEAIVGRLLTQQFVSNFFRFTLTNLLRCYQLLNFR